MKYTFINFLLLLQFNNYYYYSFCWPIVNTISIMLMQNMELPYTKCFLHILLFFLFSFFCNYYFLTITIDFYNTASVDHLVTLLRVLLMLIINHLILTTLQLGAKLDIFDKRGFTPVHNLISLIIVIVKKWN